MGRSDRCKTSDVGFESAASPAVFYQLTLTGNMSGPHLGIGEPAGAVRKQRSTLRNLQTGRGEREASCQNPLNDGAQVKHEGEDQHKFYSHGLLPFSVI